MEYGIIITCNYGYCIKNEYCAMFSLEHIIQIVLKHYYEYVLGNSRFQKIELGSKLNRIILPICL